MNKRQRSRTAFVFIALALAFSGYFAIFGSTDPELPNPKNPALRAAALPENPAPLTPEFSGSAEPAAVLVSVEEKPEAQEVVEVAHTPAPAAQVTPRAVPDELETFLKEGNWPAARTSIAARFSTDIPDSLRRLFADRSIDLNQTALVRQADPRDVVIHEVQSGEVLTTIARKYPTLNGQWGTLPLVNNLTNVNTLRLHQKLRIPRGEWSLLADKSMFRLWLLYQGTPFKEYVIAIGKDEQENATPAATFLVRSKCPKPAWTDPKGSGVFPYGHKQNPLGEYWIALDHDLYNGIGIHGTNDESVIGTRASMGCIRMHNTEVVEIASVIYPKMSVTIVE